jgi:hypothetical protein
MKKNYDNVFIRDVIVGALGYLREKIYIYNQVDETRRQIIEIPFFYSLAGDEKFLQDAFLKDTLMDPKTEGECFSRAEGNYDPIPRGVVKYQGSQIRTDSLTNPTVRCSYTKDIGGQIKTFSAMTSWFPLTINMEVEIRCDTMLDVMKIQQELIRNLYISESFIVLFEGFNIHSRIQFPEENTVEKQFEFSYDSPEKPPAITFAIQIETYLPKIDKSTEYFAGNTMQSITADTDNENSPLVITAPLSTIIQPPSFPIPVVTHKNSLNI